MQSTNSTIYAIGSTLKLSAHIPHGSAHAITTKPGTPELVVIHKTHKLQQPIAVIHSSHPLCNLGFNPFPLRQSTTFSQPLFSSVSPHGSASFPPPLSVVSVVVVVVVESVMSVAPPGICNYEASIASSIKD
jgi:hypothetical protein